METWCGMRGWRRWRLNPAASGSPRIGTSPDSKGCVGARRYNLVLARCGVVLGEQAFHLRVKFVSGLAIQLAAGGSRESGVDEAHPPVAAQEKRRRPGVQIHRLRELGVAFVRSAAEQHGVIDAVLLNERPQPGWICELILFFKGERDNFQALAAILAIQLSQERRFVVTIGTPASCDVH